ncbi:MAG: RNA chaperone ProQ [Succinivibrio sp.]|nr:RNA chaperone ProQ [Succinivibrio sp.]
METQNNNEAAKTENEVASKNSEVKADKNVHFEHVKETLELLYKTFPKAFVKDGEVKPLKIGIFDDLKERIASVEGLSITKVRAALRMYTARLKYLYSVKEGVARIDLDGNATEDLVNAQHESYAKERIAEINSKRKPQKPKNNAGKKNFVKKPFNGNKPQAKKPFKIEGDKANVEDLKQGTEVLVLSSEQHFVRGVVAQDATKDTVYVTLKSGLTVNLPLQRVLLPKKAK